MKFNVVLRGARAAADNARERASRSQGARARLAPSRAPSSDASHPQRANARLRLIAPAYV
jgi:hypothetical protein